MDKLSGALVFVVDDERVIAETLAAILNKNGFHAVPFANPLQALRAGANDAPDLLISDVMMPQLSGVELAIRMKAQCPQCRILLFSGQTETDDLLESARGRGHTFPLLAKPLHPRELLRQIEDPATAWAPRRPGADQVPWH